MLHKDQLKGQAPGTADDAEIARFNALAQEWWNPDGAFKIMHAFNAVRVRHLARRLPVLLGCDPGAALPLRGIDLLDAGCGGGLVSEPMARLGARVLGIDAAARNVAIAARHCEGSGLDLSYRHALPEACADLAGKFACVLSLEVVEHVADVDAFLAAIARLVAPGGLLVIGTLNRTWSSYAKAIIGAEYLMRWLPRGTHTWRKFVTPTELEHALQRDGFSVVERCGVALNPLDMRWRVGGDLSAAYLQFHRRG